MQGSGNELLCKPIAVAWNTTVDNVLQNGKVNCTGFGASGLRAFQLLLGEARDGKTDHVGFRYMQFLRHVRYISLLRCVKSYGNCFRRWSHKLMVGGNFDTGVTPI